MDSCQFCSIQGFAWYVFDAWAIWYCKPRLWLFDPRVVGMQVNNSWATPVTKFWNTSLSMHTTLHERLAYTRQNKLRHVIYKNARFCKTTCGITYKSWCLRIGPCEKQSVVRKTQVNQSGQPSPQIQICMSNVQSSIFALLAARLNAAAVRLTCLLVARLNWRRQRLAEIPAPPPIAQYIARLVVIQHVKNSTQMIGNTVSSQNFPQNIPFDFIRRLRQIQVYDPSAVLSNNKLAANKCSRAEPEQQSSSCSVLGTGWPKKNCEFKTKRAKRNVTYSSRNNTKMNLQETLRSEGRTNKQKKCFDIENGRCWYWNKARMLKQTHHPCRFRLASPCGPSWVGAKAGGSCLCCKFCCPRRTKLCQTPCQLWRIEWWQSAMIDAGTPKIQRAVDTGVGFSIFCCRKWTEHPEFNSGSHGPHNEFTQSGFDISPTYVVRYRLQK